jgi:hypothetical protein
MHRILLCCILATVAVGLLQAPGGMPATAAAAATDDLIIALPGAGGAARDLYLSVPWTGSAPATSAFAVRAWLQQTDLQPSQISKQQRTVTDVMRFERIPDGWSFRLRAVIQSPAQARQPAVVERLIIDGVLATTDQVPTGLTRVWSQPPWRRTDLPLPGSLFTGQTTITHETAIGDKEPTTVPRSMAAWMSQEPRPVVGGAWSRSGDGRIAIDDTTGAIVAHLHERPSDAGEGPMARRHFAAPVAGNFDGVEIDYVAESVAAPTRLNVAVRCAGQWQQASVPLAAGTRTVRVPAADMAGEGSLLVDPDGVGIGLTSGHGAGAVRLRIAAIRLIPAAAKRLGPTVVQVDLAHTRVRNGIDRVGPGLFGVHATGGIKPETAESLKTMGIGSVRTIEHTGFAPYTGPPGRDGAKQIVAAVGCDPLDTVDCWSHGLLSFPPWGGDRDGFAKRIAAFAASLKTHGPAAGIVRWEFFNEPFMWARHINLPDKRLTDPSQHGYLPADLCAQVYTQLFTAAAAELRGSGIRMGGPSSAEVTADDWRHLEQFVLPVIRGGGADFTFLAEHHYQGDPRQFAAQYAVVQAAVAAFRGPIEVWNTECNDLADRPGSLDTPEKLDRAKSLAQRRAFYHISEICDHIAEGFDHTRGRSVHALWSGTLDIADAQALRLMRQLRGQPMPVSIPEGIPGHRSRLAAAATRDGTQGTLVLASRTGDVISLPGLRGHIAGMTVLVADDKDLLRLEQRDPPTGTDIQIVLKPFEAIAIALNDLPTATPQRETVRWAADAQGRGALWRLGGGGSLDLQVHGMPPAGRANLLVIAEDADGDEASCIVAGADAAIPLPRSDGALRIRRIPLTSHAADMQLSVKTAADADGWRLCALGIETIDP